MEHRSTLNKWLSSRTVFMQGLYCYRLCMGRSLKVWPMSKLEDLLSDTHTFTQKTIPIRIGFPILSSTVMSSVQAVEICGHFVHIIIPCCFGSWHALQGAKLGGPHGTFQFYNSIINLLLLFDCSRN